jgi:hypothetical protein
VDYLRTLTKHERVVVVYKEAMEHEARQWAESEEGKAFKQLPYSEQVALCMRVTREGNDILLTHGMRLAMRKW